MIIYCWLPIYLQSAMFIAPAMDLDMFKHSSTVNNINKLESYGNILIPSGFGELASGWLEKEEWLNLQK